MTRKVYRIETVTGRGICAATGSPLCDLYRRLCHDETEHCSLHMTRSERQAIRKCDDTATFAFPTLEALRIWFPQARGRQVMEKHGARGVIYEVPEVLTETKYQCLFDKAIAKKVGEFDLVHAELC